MSGHNKWAQIKHKKAITDAKKGVAFGKLARAITVAARGNPDPATNVRLKAEVDRARAANMPIDNIERAIRRISDKDSNTLSDLQLELIGPGSIAIIAKAITDSSNRTINEIKQLCSRMGARLVNPGSVSWMFTISNGVYTPQHTVRISDEPVQVQAHAFLDALQDHDDIQEVYTNEESTS